MLSFPSNKAPERATKTTTPAKSRSPRANSRRTKCSSSHSRSLIKPLLKHKLRRRESGTLKVSGVKNLQSVKSLNKIWRRKRKRCVRFSKPRSLGNSSKIMLPGSISGSRRCARKFSERRRPNGKVRPEGDPLQLGEPSIFISGILRLCKVATKYIFNSFFLS